MTLPDWLDPLFDADEMRAADAYAIEEAGVPSLDLMERAGLGLARLAAEVAPDGRLAVVVGKGNNGGDGLVAARALREDGREADVLAVAPLDELEGDARANLERLPGPVPRAFEPAALDGAAAVVDALLGTGFSGTVREPVAGAIEAINATDRPVVACDVPSGIDASSGEVEDDAVEATATATFHGSKIGLYVAPGSFRSGEVRVIDIGMPREAPGAATAGLISERVLELVPPRTREGSKFTSGTVIVAGGARGLTGAPCLSALAAMRCGAGYVQVAVPASAEPVFDQRLLEALTHGLPEDDGAHVPAGVDEVLELAARGGAIVLGPGIGRSDGALEFARELARRAEAPMLIDADGLNAHAGRLDSLAGRPGPTVLTPHAGELARLLDTDSSEVGEHRLHYARAAAERSGCVVVLKGDDSLVAAPGGPVAVSSGSTPALATAGTGDVLSGIVGTLLAKGLDPFPAAAAGVLVHARAGKVAAARVGADHTIASDVVDAVPAVMSEAG